MANENDKREQNELVHPSNAGFVERVTPKEPGDDIFMFKCPKDGGIHFRHAGYVEIMAPFMRPGAEKRVAVESYPVKVCVSCKSCFVWINEQMYDVTDRIDLEAWQKTEREAQAATGPGGQC